jgi:hypothetical protein
MNLIIGGYKLNNKNYKKIYIKFPESLSNIEEYTNVDKKIIFINTMNLKNQVYKKTNLYSLSNIAQQIP